MTVLALRPRLLRLLLPLLVMVFTAISGNALAGPKPASGQFLPAATLIGAEPLQDATSHQAVWKIAPKPAAACCVAAETAGAAATEGTVTVGRFMSPNELSAMQETGLVQESFNNGVTSVTLPPNPGGYLAAPSGDVFVQFDVPESAIGAGPGSTGVAKIYGPNSIFGPRLGITQMPPAFNITVPGQ